MNSFLYAGSEALVYYIRVVQQQNTVEHQIVSFPFHYDYSLSWA